MSVRSFYVLLSCLLLTACMGMGSRTPAPVVVHGQTSGAGSAGVHNVVRGDTLYSISNRYRLPMRDIAVLNKIQPPFKLYEGQRLRLPPPQEYKVRAGDTLYEISRLFGVNSSEVARLNNMNPPYIVRAGETIRLPSVTRKTTLKKTKAVARDREKTASVPQPRQEPRSKDGVPVPSDKPPQLSRPKTTKISKVTRKAPKRSSSKFLRPVRGKVLSRYGAKKSGLHNDGINIAAPRGTAVKTAENGVVVYAGNALKGSGNLVLVRHDGQWMTAYAHLDQISVRKGQVLKRGSKLGTVGSTGAVSTPQLHFEVRRGTSAMNPSKYMD